VILIEAPSLTYYFQRGISAEFNFTRKGGLMRFYTAGHYYCGVDLHTRSLYICNLDQDGEVLVHQKLLADPDAFLSLNSSLSL